jgi:hypothetical protein
MPRIRTIKPEFWKSEAIAALPKETRLTFIGLWTYVDDNGVGLDNPKLITAELYALEEDPRDTLASVSRDMLRLAGAGRIRRYTVDGKGYFEIVGWREHQRIDRPNKPRYPHYDHPDALPVTCGLDKCEGSDSAAIATPSRESRDTLARVQRPEQWNRGTEEQGISAAAPPKKRGTAALAVVADDPSAQALLAAWIDHCHDNGVQLPARVKGAYARGIKENLDSGIAPDLIKAALGKLLARGAAHQPSWLASEIVAVQTGPLRRNRLTPGEEAMLKLTDNGHNGEVVAAVQDFFSGIARQA